MAAKKKTNPPGSLVLKWTNDRVTVLSPRSIAAFGAILTFVYIFLVPSLNAVDHVADAIGKGKAYDPSLYAQVSLSFWILTGILSMIWACGAYWDLKGSSRTKSKVLALTPAIIIAVIICFSLIAYQVVYIGLGWALYAAR